MKFDAQDYQKYMIEFIKAWLIVIRPVPPSSALFRTLPNETDHLKSDIITIAK